MMKNMSACTGVDEQIDMGKTGGEFFLLRMTHPKKAGMTEEGILNTFGSWTDKQVFENIVVYTWDKEQV